ncbi:MAG: hypothetical protein HN380_30555 [Victivallales bacterium]|nr:hypothetical protein [Victivallales bacterium]
MTKLMASIKKSPSTSAKDGKFRELVVESICTGQARAGLAFLEKFIGSGFRRNKGRTLNSLQAGLLAHAGDATAFLRLVHNRTVGTTFRPDVLAWLTKEESRYQLFLNTVSLVDYLGKTFGIVDKLYDHDPEGRDEFVRLILAMAVVWDQPRPPIHRQMGGKQLPYEPDLLARYDYFRDLYASKRSEMPYEELSVAALCIVVDTPVPVAELRWARENESPRGWDKKYSSIVYVDERLAAAVYQWPGGPYTLAAIKEKGGICVDQGYYAVMAARAWGLPALFFGGEGRRGPHAWIGYMKSKTRWEMEVGRYTYDKYATGHAVDPQTNRPMSDHYVESLCDRTLAYGRYRQAARSGRLASVLCRLGYRAAARQAAERSLEIAPRYESSWELLEGMLREKRASRKLYELLEKKAHVYRRYDDFVAEIRKQEAALLRALGEGDRAERLLANKAKRMNRDRDDLTRLLANEQIKAAYLKGDYAGARKKFEKLLEDQQEEGQKMFELLGNYLMLAVETGQAVPAAKFTKRYINDLRGIYDDTPANERVFLSVLATAYQLAGDEKNLKRTKKKLARVK